MTIGCGPGGSATVLAANSSMGTAGESPAACTCELRLYPPCPSIAAGVTKPGSLDMDLLLVRETSIVHMKLAEVRAWGWLTILAREPSFAFVPHQVIRHAQAQRRSIDVPAA